MPHVRCLENTMSKLNPEQRKKWVVPTVIGGVVVVSAAIILPILLIRQNNINMYELGVQQLVNREFNDAYNTFSHLGHFKDSNKKKDYAYQLKIIDQGMNNYEKIIDDIVSYQGMVTTDFDEKGGEAIPNRNITEKSDNKYIYEIAFKQHYDFANWDLTYGRYDRATDAVIIKLDANYGEHKYSISYELDGGAISSDAPLHYTYFQDDLAVPNATKAGYTFNGYVVNKSGDPVKNYVIPHNSYGDITLSAKYSANMITVNLDAGEGTVDPTSFTALYDTDVSATMPVASREGYSFAGWLWGNVHVTPEKFNVSENGATLTARYLPIQYKINYVLDGGSFTGLYPETYNIETPDLYLPYPHKDGYMFVGWTRAGSGIRDIHSFISKGTMGDVTFTAHYVPYETASGNPNRVHEILSDNDVSQIVFPKEVLEFDDRVIIEDLPKLVEFDVEADSPFVVKDDCLIVNNGTSPKLLMMPKYKYSTPSVKNITIPDVNEIGPYVFNGFDIEHLEASNTLTKVGEGAFKGCDRLISLNNVSKITDIGEETFSGCTNLNTEILLNNDNLRNIGKKAFFNCTTLNSAVFSSSMVSVGDEAFSGCAGIKLVEFKSGIKAEFGAHVFSDCTDIERVVVDTNFVETAVSALSDVKSFIKHVTVKNKGDLPLAAFESFTALNEIVFDNTSFKEIQENTFKKTTSLTSITIPKEVTRIASSAFVDSGITSVTFEDPENLLTIETYAFATCGITSIDLSKARHLTIEKNAFFRCDSLEEISLYYDTLDNISYGFNECGHIKTFNIYYDEGLTGNIDIEASFFENVTSVEEINFIYVKKEAISGEPLTVNFSTCAFRNCESLLDINLFNMKVGELGPYAFENCRNFLNTNDIVSNLPTYPIGCFFGCEMLSNLTINGTVSIGKYCFVGCDELGSETGFNIPNTVTAIGREAFAFVSPTYTLNVDFTLEEVTELAKDYGDWYLWDMNYFGTINYKS